MHKAEAGILYDKEFRLLPVYGISLISPEQISCIHFLFHIIQTSVITVGDNRLALRFESVQVIYHFTTEKSTAIL